jgi:hypothetical protein
MMRLYEGQNMIRKTLAVALFVGGSLITIQPAMARQGKIVTAHSDTKAKMRRLVDTYVQSIEDADTKLGATVGRQHPM